MSNQLPLEIRVLREVDQVEQIADQWNQLSADVPFGQWNWYGPWWNAYGTPRQLHVLAVYDQTELIGIAPFYRDHSPAMGHSLRMLGDGEACSDHQTIISAAENKQTVGSAVGDWLVAQASAQANARDGDDFTMMLFEGVDGDCPAMIALLETLDQGGFSTHASSSIHTWRIPLPESQAEYERTLAKSPKQKIRHSLRYIDTGKLRESYAQDNDSLLRSWNVLVDLHQQRWRSLGEPGCFSRERFSQFLFDAAQAFMDAGKLELIVIEDDEKPISSQICFCGTDMSYVYQVGINPDALQLNPGWLVNAALIRHSIEQGRKAYDLCRGDLEYKRHMGAVATPSMRYRIVPPKLKSQVIDAALVTGSALKNWCKWGLEHTGLR